MRIGNAFSLVIFTITLCIIIDSFIVSPHILKKDLSSSRKTSIPKSQTNLNGKKMFRGINIGNALEAPSEGAWGVYIRDEYFSIIKSAGFDTVRIPIRWSAYAKRTQPYTIAGSFFKRIDHVVNKSLEQGLITIINMHNYDEIMQSPSSHKERFLEMWRQIAERYKDYPEDLYFELLNEPHGELTDSVWSQIVKETIAVIRKTNPTRKIIIGPANWNSAYNLGMLEVPDDPNIIVTFHFYTPFEFTHQGAEWVSPSPPVGRKWTGTEAEKSQIRRELDIAYEWSKRHGNITLLMGEFGAYSKADMESRVKWTYFVAREAEKRGIAWCYWEFCSSFGAYDPVGKKWREELLNALIPGAGGKFYVSIETDCGSFTGEGWYDKGSYATIRFEEVQIGFPIACVLDHFEGLKAEDRIVDDKTIEVYVDENRIIRVVWRKDYTPLILIVTLVCILACAAIIFYRKRVKTSGKQI
ncbi:MAG: glycoside hydrolase family 5 protein [Thermoproteota archaeon]